MIAFFCLFLSGGVFYSLVLAADTDGDGLSDDVDFFPYTPLLQPTLEIDNSVSGQVTFSGTGEVGTQIRVFDDTNAELCQTDVLGNGVVQGNAFVLDNISAQFFYNAALEINDTWRNNASVSFFGETKDDVADQICDYQTGDGDGDPRLGSDDRCGADVFPMRSLFIADENEIFIFDADTKDLWMSFLLGNDLGVQTAGSSGNVSSLFFSEGILWVAFSGGFVSQVDFVNDEILWYQTSGVFEKTGNISQRNTVTGSVQVGLNTLPGANIFDMYAREISGKMMLAVATDVGVSVINVTDGSQKNLAKSLATQIPQRVEISLDGVLYIGIKDGVDIKLAAHENIHTLSHQYIWDDANRKYEDISGVAPEILFSDFLRDVEHISDTEMFSGNTLHIGTENGLTEISEFSGNFRNGATRFVQHNSTTMPMIGDVRGHWTMDGNDRSQKGNHLTNMNSVIMKSVNANTDLQSFSFNGTSQYLESASSDFQFDGNSLTVGAWIKRKNIGGTGPYQKIFSQGETDESYFLSAGENFFSYSISQDPFLFGVQTSNGWKAAAVQKTPVANTWEFIVGTYNGTYISIYRNGFLEQQISHSGNIVNLNEKLFVGRSFLGQYFEGEVALPFLSATSYENDQVAALYNFTKNWFEADAKITLFGNSSEIQDIECDDARNICVISTPDGVTQLNTNTGVTTEVASGTNVPILTNTRLGDWSCTIHQEIDSTTDIIGTAYQNSDASHISSESMRIEGEGFLFDVLLENFLVGEKSGETEIRLRSLYEIPAGGRIALIIPTEFVADNISNLIPEIQSITAEGSDIFGNISSAELIDNQLTITFDTNISAGDDLKIRFSENVIDQNPETPGAHDFEIYFQDAISQPIESGTEEVFISQLNTDLALNIVVQEALIMTIDAETVEFMMDASINNGIDTSQFTKLTIRTNSELYTILGRLENPVGNNNGLYFSPNGMTDEFYIANGTGRNNFGYNINAVGEATDAFSDTDQMIFSPQQGRKNNQIHNIFYDMNIGYETVPGLYEGDIIYTAMPAF